MSPLPPPPSPPPASHTVPFTIYRLHKYAATASTSTRSVYNRLLHKEVVRTCLQFTRGTVYNGPAFTDSAVTQFGLLVYKVQLHNLGLLAPQVQVHNLGLLVCKQVEVDNLVLLDLQEVEVVDHLSEVVSY